MLIVFGCLFGACRGSSARQVRISLLPPVAVTGTPNPSLADQQPVVAPTPLPTPSPPPVTVTGSYKLAVPDALAPELTLALQAFAADYPKLKISLQSVPDSAAAIKSGADLTVVLRYPGTAAPDHSTVVLRHPIAIMLPLTLSPNDLSVGQVVDLLTGGVADWEQVGGTKRPIRLALSDPAQLAAVGALAGRPDARPLVTARVDAAQVLLAETDAGLDEAAVVPWTGARLKSKALRIDGMFPDDANYLLSTDLVLVPLRKEGQTLADQAGPVLAARLAPQHAGSVSIDAVGDLMLGRGVAAMVQRHGSDWPFARVSERLRSADVRFGNLELALTDRGTQSAKDYTFRAPPDSVQSLVGAGINVVDVANNHVLDFGTQGLLDTISTVARNGIFHIGAGSDGESARTPAIVMVNGIRIAWLAYVNVPDDSISGFVARSLEGGPGRPGVAWGTPDVIARDVTAARQRSDVVIVALHSGFEYTSEPNSVQKDLAHAAIDAGAALVLGAHPHVLQGIEFYHGGLIAYSLGNFLFDLDASDIAHYGLPSVLTVVLRVNLDSRGVTGIEVYPAIINRNDFRPEPVAGDAARPVFDRIYKLTDGLNGGNRP